MAPLCVSRSSEAQRLSNCNQQTMNMFEVEEQKQLLFQLCPSYTHGILQTGLLGEVKKTRKRRRKSNKGEGNGELKKRKLSDEQVHLLEMKFGEEHKLESERKDKLAMDLGLDPKTVAVWFQNRRARWKTKKLEEEYSKLKNAHEKVVVEKCHLEAEVLNLQEKLSQTEEKLSMFSKQTDGVSISSPSSLSVDSNLQQLPHEFMVDGLDNLLCVPEYDYVQGIWGWVNMYD